jgi:hypothetical protein
VIKISGFSSGNEYLWGGISGWIEISVFFSIEIKTGELIVYEFNDYDEFEELLEEYPYDR